MSQTCHDTGGHDDELVEVLTEISRVSARMARDIKILAAHRQSKEGGQANVEDERDVTEH
ncbi:MAG: hypothetical protein LUE20_10870 [Oscillospiraceae bacterium]|nr:hypothetical protein [Oscillospiraceae bacterium]